MKQWRTSELEKLWNDVFEGKEDIKKKKKEVTKLRKDIKIKENLISGMKTKL